ncbi:amidophosphoribosyltransferase [Flavobacteriaceae bacterium]|nr:amidophosphoribosyltransferase [Flavobacteriaceae bacterium]MDA9192871.1 amidophosphoribosyltransferase [Flavobacteriaceae bacterium]MDC6462251.1 amidophosphoribosyltransferase [Flavobacteriaceae bacterium]
MSDQIKHECGIALVHLKKPLHFYQQKYGSYMYGVDKMFLMMEKQKNRGQDGAGYASIKFDLKPGQKYFYRVRSFEQQAIHSIFKKINKKINSFLKSEKIKKGSDLFYEQTPFLGQVMLGHVRYGTYGKNSIDYVQPMMRQNNWMNRNLILAGNFNMTNTDELFQSLVKLGQHPREQSDTITIMEKIGHFLDSEVISGYNRLKKKGVLKSEMPPLIEKDLNIEKILKKSSKKWDGGYAIAGMMGHGDSFVLRDPNGIRPAYFYEDDEVVVVASERPAIQTVFDVSYSNIKEVPRGNALIIKKNGETSIKEILKPKLNKSCSFERIYFSRGSDADIYKERKMLGSLLIPQIEKSIKKDYLNTVFSFIPNTAETSFYGLIERAKKHNPRIEKIAIKDAKLRTFISADKGREDLVAHVYDITYGIIERSDTLVIIDDSIVRGTTLQESILKMLFRLNPKKIVVVSSAPQIRYPDCYGIDMAKIEDFIAFRAAIEIHRDNGTYDSVIEKTYIKCKNANESGIYKKNHVKDIYKDFSPEQISFKMCEMLVDKNTNVELDIIFQKVENLHKACKNHKGDWYFTGNYPTIGGNKVVNQAFINFVEGKSARAY